MIKNNSDIAIEVKNLTKKYFLGEVGSQMIREEITNFVKSLFNKNKAKNNVFWALDDVSFKIQKGDTVGIIGANGSGKSTILKILSKITYPTSGIVKIRGRIASLLEVGTGFNPELTGRENIFLNGVILGMNRKEIGTKFEKIVKFSEIGQFLDTPVKRYSSGMYIRLAFSIAAHLESEILLIDEVLSVGDIKFQKKSIKKMDQITGDKNRTIIFVSHDLNAIRKICDKCILIDKGKIVRFGDTGDVINKYYDIVEEQEHSNLKSPSIHRTGTGKVVVRSVTLVDQKSKVLKSAMSGDKIYLVFNYTSNGTYNNVNLSFSIHTQDQRNLILQQSKYSNTFFKVKKGIGKIIFSLDRLPLIAGIYYINLRVDINGEESDFPRQPMLRLVVENGDFYKTKVIPLEHSPILIDGSWENIYDN